MAEVCLGTKQRPSSGTPKLPSMALHRSENYTAFWAYAVADGMPCRRKTILGYTSSTECWVARSTMPHPRHGTRRLPNRCSLICVDALSIFFTNRTKRETAKAWPFSVMLHVQGLAVAAFNLGVLYQQVSSPGFCFRPDVNPRCSILLSVQDRQSSAFQW